mgnify:FL=1
MPKRHVSLSTGRVARNLLAGALLPILAGCASYSPAPIDPHTLHAEWFALDARRATEAVAAALPERTAAEPGFNLDDGITLAEAETAALFLNPEMARLRASLGVSLATARSAGDWQDPALGVDGDHVLASIPDRLTWSGSLSITIPLSGRPGLERRLAEAQLERGEAIALGAEWALVADLRREWLQLAQVDARILLIEGAITDLDRLVEASPAFKAARAMSVVEERLLLLGRARAKEERLTALAERAEWRLMILSRLGLHPDHNWRLIASMPDVTTIEDPSHSAPDFEALLAHPSLSIAMAAYAVAERTLAREVRRQIPDLTIGLGAGREDGDSTLVFGLGLLPIPIWNRNREGIATAEAERAAARIETESILRDLVGRRAIEHAHFHSARERLVFLENEVAPLADAKLDDARRLTALGRLDLILLVEAVEEQRRVRLELLGARAAALDAQISLEALTAPCPTHLAVSPEGLFHDHKAGNATPPTELSPTESRD